MRRFVLPVTALVFVAGCGGAADREEFERLRDEVDSSARIMGITVSEALDADLPTGTDLGTGSTLRCTGRSGAVSYHVETELSHEPIEAGDALDLVTDALEAEGYRARFDDGAGILRVRTGDVDAEVSSRQAGGLPTVAGIFVSTGCIEVGESLAGELAAEPGRPVRR